EPALASSLLPRHRDPRPQSARRSPSEPPIRWRQRVAKEAPSGAVRGLGGAVGRVARRRLREISRARNARTAAEYAAARPVGARRTPRRASAPEPERAAARVLRSPARPL